MMSGDGSTGRVLATLLLTTAVGSSVMPAMAASPPGPTGSAAGDARPAPGSGVWPLRPRPPVVAGFHPPAERWGAGHRGVDLGGHVGQAVRVALAGRVTFAGRLAGRGVVVVDHGATRTTYEPVTASVQVGDRVSAGATIGHLELFGSHCFPRACLHWGWIEGRDHYLDPLVLVGAAPVVLLPVGSLPALRAALPTTPAPPRQQSLSAATTTRPAGVVRQTVGAGSGPLRYGAARAPFQALGWAWR